MVPETGTGGGIFVRQSNPTINGVTLGGTVTLSTSAAGARLFRFNNFNSVWFQGVASAVNYLKLTNSATGNPITIEADGTDTDIGILLVPKGAGTGDLNGKTLTMDVDADTYFSAATDDILNTFVGGNNVAQFRATSVFIQPAGAFALGSSTTLQYLYTATVAAAGSDQSGAASITALVTTVTGADGVKGVKLPLISAAGVSYFIANESASTLLVYPNTGDQINKAGANVAVYVPPYTLVRFMSLDSSEDWYSTVAQSAVNFE